VRVGEVGDGHAMKLVNNFVAMSYAALYSEALVLARKAGLRPEVVDGVLRGSRMDCGFYQTFMSYVLERNRDAHRFTLTNASKDMRYVTAMGDALGVANPIAAAVKNGFAVAVAQGRGQDYVPMLSDVVANLNGTSLVD
jgi:3-hydroxyisobutyrate dehydrogenase-like beta-hydroxyacid dehydrogenase